MALVYSFIFVVGVFLGKFLNFCINEIIKNDEENKIKIVSIIFRVYCLS
ncbi:hypothetical protein [Clostridium sp. Marseille-QA1073]